MKGRLLDRCPGAVLVDVGHSVPPFDVVSGAFVLWAGTRHFPPGAVHLAVVDPGVGGDRRALALRVGGSWYVGPDNGLLALVLSESGVAPEAAIRLERPAGASATFEGRDTFAPAAAALAAGRGPETLGTPLEGDPLPLPVRLPAVLWVDAFGNLVTSLRPPLVPLRINGQDVVATARTFGDAPPDTPFLYEGSMGFVEIGIRRARADERLGAAAGTPVDPSNTT